MTLTSAETTLIQTLLCMFGELRYPKIVLNNLISKKMCFKVNNVPLKMN